MRAPRLGVQTLLLVLCSAGCTTQCTSGTQPVQTDAYAFTASTTMFATTRALDATFFTNASLQSAAGCMTGYTENATELKQ